MQKLSGKDMIAIDVANCFGHDKEIWDQRLLWTEMNAHRLEDLIDKAAEPLLYTKAVNAYRAMEAGEPTGHIMFLDATASGLQIMAALSGCKKTAAAVNMINTGEREDVYEHIVNDMNLLLNKQEQVDRNMIKKPCMTHFYNKTRQDSLSENQQTAFYTILSGSFSGAEDVKNLINGFWDPTATMHRWTLPDGHVSQVKVTEMKDARIEVDELYHTTFTYRFEVNTPSESHTSLVPNIIHSIDAYIVREIVRRGATEGLQVAHIHDAFCAHPNNMQRIRELYVEIMTEIADSDLLEDILTEIAGYAVVLHKDSTDLSKDIMQSDYMLS